MTNANFDALEQKVDELIQLCADMKYENKTLRDSEHGWQEERESLLGKNQLARVRLEKVLTRLKSIEQG